MKTKEEEIFGSLIFINNEFRYPNENELNNFLLEKGLDKETINCIIKLLNYTYNLGAHDEYYGGVFNGIRNPFN